MGVSAGGMRSSRVLLYTSPSQISSRTLSLLQNIGLASDMNFLHSCWEVLLLLASHSQTFEGYLASSHQRPLGIAEPHNDDHGIVSSAGVSFKVAGTNFTCQYPSMTGYTACNNPLDRQCWLRGSSTKDVTYDIHTECS